MLFSPAQKSQFQICIPISQFCINRDSLEIKYCYVKYASAMLGRWCEKSCTSFREERELERWLLSSPWIPELPLLRINRTNEAVWLRHGAPVIFFSDASNACPSVRPSIYSDSSWSIGRRHPVAAPMLRRKRETPWRSVARRRLTWHAVLLDKNVTRTKLTSPSRPFHFTRQRRRLRRRNPILFFLLP